MPHYYFNVYNGADQLDEDGLELSGPEAARLEALQSAGSILKDEALSLALGEDWRMVVTDETGLILFRLDFTVHASSAVNHGERGSGRQRTQSSSNLLVKH